MSVKPVAWRMQSADGTVDSVELRGPDKWEIENLTITPLYSAPAPELAEALQKLVDTFGVRHETYCRFDCDESPDCGKICSCEAHSFQAEIVSLLARITPK